MDTLFIIIEVVGVTLGLGVLIYIAWKGELG